MKLVKQSILFFREGKSDKVYEVDLCQVGADQYVVNFRYGRRGSALRDGTKTPRPVSLSEAERHYARLVADKVNKGYRSREDGGSSPAAAGAPGATAPTSSPTSSSTGGPRTRPRGLGPREQAILARLRDDEEGRALAIKLDRAIWRAGELDLTEAEPLLLDLWKATSRGQAMRRYSIVWALGRCGSDAAIPVLEGMVDDAGEAENTRRMALEALRRLYDDGRRARLIAGQISKLPAELRELATSGPASALAAALQELLGRGERAAFGALLTCYLIDNEHVRPALIEILRTAPFQENYFQRIRQIFKAAEFRRDGQVFGLLAYRFEKMPATPGIWYHRRDRNEPFLAPTRRYLRRRVWRTLRRLGRDRSPDFVKMAVGVLLPFTDQDAGTVMTRRYYRWRAPDSNIIWDLFAGYWAFNYLLHGQSSRYHPDANGRAWRCSTSYSPGEPAPRAREESFPELWDQTPEALLHLLDESQCQRVHEFAVKALRACKSFIEDLDASVAAMLLSRAYLVTAELGLELATRLYRPGLPDDERRELIAAAAECRLVAARAQARTWIDAERHRLSGDTRLMALLAGSAYPENRQFARDLFRTVMLSGDTARALIGRLVAMIKGLGAEDSERIADIGTTLLTCFGRELSGIGVAIIADLMEHPSAGAQELAGRLLLNHAELARTVPDRILFALLDSPHEAVRKTGATLLAQLSDAALMAHRELLVLLSVHEHEDLRTSIRPVLARLGAAHPDFAASMVDAFTAELMHKHERGVHSHLLAVLKDDLRPYLGHVSKAQIWKLLHHKHPHAQELGGVLLDRIGADELSVAEIVKLASHEILAVRQGAWAMCERALDRLKHAMPMAVRLLDARWDDSRAFAFGFFRDKLSREELTPDILVAVCDSIRPDVQQFGRELITRYFREEDGHTYLARLSEHPAEALQLFATNYLEGYASGHPERIRELEPYFVTVLSQVNKARVAKARCVAFLQREAQASQDAADTAARIFGRQSVTMAIGDRAAMIKAMVDIELGQPGVDTLVRIIEPPLRAPESERGPEVRHGV